MLIGTLKRMMAPARKPTPTGMEPVEPEEEEIDSLPSYRPGINKDRHFLEAFEKRRELRGPVHAIGEDGSAVKWRLFEDTPEGPKEIKEHEFLDLWDNPHPMVTGTQFRYLALIYIDLTGTAPVWLQKTVNGLQIDINPNQKPDRMMILPPNWVEETPRESKNGRYNVRLSGSRRRRMIEPHAIMNFQRPHPSDPYGFGLGIAACLADEIELGRAMSKFSLRSFLNGSFLGNIITMPIKGTIAKWQAKWAARFSGVDNANKDIFTNPQDGEVKVTPLGHSMKELSFFESREQNRDFCAQGFQVPPARLGVLENANRSTVNVTDLHQQKYNVLPRLRILRDVVNTRLLPRYGKNLRLEFENPVKETEDQILNRVDRGFRSGWILMNEAREAFDYPLCPWGDAFSTPVNNVRFFTFNEGPNFDEDPGQEEETEDVQGPE